MQINPRIIVLLLIFFLAAPTLTACANKTVSDSSTNNLDQADDNLSVKTLSGRFNGILPCADCTGWNTLLELEPNGKFTLTEQSLDEHEALFVQTSGTWTVEDGPIPFIALHAQNEKDKDPRYYEVISPERLIFVGLDKQQIETELDYSLTRVDTP